MIWGVLPLLSNPNPKKHIILIIVPLCSRGFGMKRGVYSGRVGSDS